MKKAFKSALDELQRADYYQPDDYKVKRGLAKTYYQIGALSRNTKQAFVWAQKAKDAALKAFPLNPLDAETAFDLARAEARLEQLYPYLYPQNKNNPYQALPYFKQALSLRPNSVFYHYTFTQYLAWHHQEKELLSEVSSLARIYPESYYYLRKEAFWSASVAEAVRQGLEQAIAAVISIRDAHRALSDLLAAAGKNAEALTHYQKFLGCNPFENSTWNYIQLGRLYLKSNQTEKAEDSFTEALDLSPTKEKDLESIYNIYKHAGYPEELHSFLQKASHRFMLSYRMDILTARSLIDLKQLPQARTILENLIRKDPVAEAHYWLARTAEQEKDWDNMELSIQKATVLEPANSHYHLLFSSALKRQGKLEGAEQEADRAIKHAAKPNPWLFNHRGWIRWNRQDFQGALQDWQSAIQIEPQKAPFYAQAGAANQKLGQWAQALEYYQKALRLDPENSAYKQKISALQSSKQY